MGLSIGRTGGDPIPDTDCRSLFHFPNYSGIGDFRILNISHTVVYLIFMTLGNMTDTDKIVSPEHYGSNQADIRILIQLNPEIWIRFWITFG